MKNPEPFVRGNIKYISIFRLKHTKIYHRVILTLPTLYIPHIVSAETYQSAGIVHTVNRLDQGRIECYISQKAFLPVPFYNSINRYSAYIEEAHRRKQQYGSELPNCVPDLVSITYHNLRPPCDVL